MIDFMFYEYDCYIFNNTHVDLGVIRKKVLKRKGIYSKKEFTEEIKKEFFNEWGRTKYNRFLYSFYR